MYDYGVAWMVFNKYDPYSGRKFKKVPEEEKLVSNFSLIE